MIELWHNSVPLRADHIRSWLRIGPGFQKSSEDFGGFTGKIREGQGKRFFFGFLCATKMQEFRFRAAYFTDFCDVQSLLSITTFTPRERLRMIQYETSWKCGNLLLDPNMIQQLDPNNN